MTRLKKLFEPIRVGQLELRNRIKMPAITLGYGTDDEVSERLKAFYAERAKGGVGLIGIALSATRLCRNPMVGLYDDRFILGLKELTDVCHAHGAKVYAQLGVGYYWCFGDSVEFVTPSGVTASGRSATPFLLGGPPEPMTPRELTTAEIHQIVDAFGESARRAREAGFDAVEFIASVGYLFSQFMSPLTNRRTDEYGSSLENRMRLLSETIECAKRKAGSDYTYACRLSGSDFLGGYDLDDTKAMAVTLQKSGVAAFDIMAGWHESPVPMVQTSVPEGAWVYMAEEVKKVVTAPVAAGIRIHDPVLAEQILAEGKADMISMARPLIADPELPNKAKEGRYTDIRPCISCSRCLGKIDDPPITCSVNARAGREAEYEIQRSVESKRVLIVGGGPAGMEAAITAAQRGHQVTLYEKGDRLGGTLGLAAVPPYKEVIDRLTSYLARQVEKHGVRVVLGQEATAEVVQEIQPDTVIIATGAKPIIPDIPGIEGSHVVTALDVLAGRCEVGSDVIVVGGGMIGCETSEFLAQRGRKVTIVEMLNRIGCDIELVNRWVIVQRLRSAAVAMETNLRVEGITDKGIVGLRDGAHVHLEGNTVVLSVGMKAEGALARQLENKVDVHLAGDCLEPRRIEDAIAEGLRVGLKI